jgi:hypothetical protein
LSLRTLSPSAVVGASVLWMIALFAVSIARAVIRTRQLAPPNTSDEVYVIVRLIGGPWLMFGPPVLLLVAWWAVRVSCTLPANDR